MSVKSEFIMSLLRMLNLMTKMLLFMGKTRALILMGKGEVSI